MIKDTLDILIIFIKEFFRTLLEIGSSIIQDKTADAVKEVYDQEIFTKHDVFDVAKNTDKERELFKYAEIPYYKALLIVESKNIINLMTLNFKQDLSKILYIFL